MTSLRLIVGTLMLFLKTAYVIAQSTESESITSSTALMGSTNASVTAQTTNAFAIYETVTTSTGLTGSTNEPTPAPDTTANDEDDDLLLGIAIGAGAVLGVVIIACVVFLVALRLHAMKKRRIASSPPDTQPLEVKNEQSAEQP